MTPSSRVALLIFTTGLVCLQDQAIVLQSHLHVDPEGETIPDVNVQAEPAERRRSLKRSPSYPGIDLEAALKRAREVYVHEKQHDAPVESVVMHWGYSPRSSGGM